MRTTTVTAATLVLLAIGIVGLVGGGASSQTTKPKPEPVSAEEIQKLVKQLGHDDFHVREAAQQRLKEIGKPAVPALREAVKSKDLEVNRRARAVLDGVLSSLEYAMECLKDTDAASLKEAAEILERQGPAAKAALPRLIELLKDKDEGVRDAVVMAIIGIDPDNKAVADMAPKKASVNGKYRKLLKRIKVEGDRQSYTDFSDYGMYTGTAYAGYTDLPPGYWVYAYPYWYIWGELKGQ